jgi:tetratricopeptide (TPR) repeat protein
VDLSLASTPSRRALLIASLATSSLVCFEAAQHWIAYHRIDSGRLESMKRGAAIEPGNAESWDRLCRFEQYDFANPDPPRAVADCLKAVAENPHSAHYWMDLATAYETAGDLQRARVTFQRARSVYPVSAEVAWTFGNFLLRQDQLVEGYAQIQQAVRADPSLLSIAISRVWRSNHDVDRLLDEVLPANVDAYFQALDFFASTQQSEPALKVWERILALHKPFALPRSFPFVDELIGQDRVEDTRRVWRQALDAAGMPYVEPANHSLIYNGNFGSDFVNGGLDWRWTAPIGVSMGFDPAPPSRGVRSLRLDFGGGSNLELGQPLQYVPVEPSRKYHLTVFLRTDHITTENGMRFSISDPHRAGAVNVLTDNLTGTNPWTAANEYFITGPDTHFVVVRLYRNASRLFDNKLSGTVWIADVSLIPADSPEQQSQ